MEYLRKWLNFRIGILLIWIFFLATIILVLINNPQRFFENDQGLEAEKVTAENISKKCTNTILWQKCYSENLIQLNKHASLSMTLSILKIIQKIDSKTNNCHLIAHKISAQEVEKDPQKWLSIFQTVKDPYDCLGGFIHGAVEGKKRYDTNLELNSITITQICNEVVKVSGPQIAAGCGHAVGHALLVEVGGDIKKGIQICSQLSDDLDNGCFEGIFMENISRNNLIDHGISKPLPMSEQTAKDLEQVCNEYSGLPLNSCWWEMAQIYFSLAGPDLKRIKTYCDRAPSEHTKYNCYLHSFNFVLVNSKFDKNQFTDICLSYQEDVSKFKQCYNWALVSLLHSSPNFSSEADMLCNRAPSYFQNQCIEMKNQKKHD